MFHAHTKIATKNSDVHKNKPLDGYFMRCNKRSIDPIGYITAPNMTPEELEKKFLFPCEKSSHIFLYAPSDEQFCMRLSTSTFYRLLSKLLWLLKLVKANFEV